MSYDKAGFGGRPTEDPYPGRRQLQELTAEDLAAQPAWWFPPEDGHLTGPDACTVLPMDASAAAPDGSCEFPEGRFLLRAEFVLADGTTVLGHVTYVAGESADVAAQEPTVCGPGGQVPLWHGALAPDAVHLAALLARLRRPHDAVFPLRWRAALHPTGAEIAGEASGFLRLQDGRIVTDGPPAATRTN